MSESQYILGLSFDYHDASACLLRDGEVVAASAEERFTRNKHDAGFPEKSILFCLDRAGIKATDLAVVVYHEDSFLKFDRIVSASLKNYPGSRAYLDQVSGAWMRDKKMEVRERIQRELKVDPHVITNCEHHEAHAASAFYSSPFEKATVVTIDGVGEYECMGVYAGEGNDLRKVYSSSLPNSVGLLYSAFTAYLGFEVNEGEYKVMGMSAYGEPTYVDEIRSLFEYCEDGTIKIDASYFQFECPLSLPYTKKLIELFGESREPESPLLAEEGQEDPRFRNIAASIQLVTEEIIFHIAEHAIRRVGHEDVCLAGGVALNSLANGKLMHRMKGRLYVQPSAGDSGCAMGAAMLCAHREKAVPRTGGQLSPFLGISYTDDEVRDYVKELREPFSKTIDDEAALIDYTASRLMEQSVIGWFQGSEEWGPRALGCRSIIASPLGDDIQDIVNRKIKFREPFRPFAPSVCEDDAAEFFEYVEPYSEFAPEYYMLAIAKVREAYRDRLPAITHVDYTARIQLVSEKTNPRYYRLIKRFGELSGVPVILNTSFNLRGEPIVNTPRDAILTFSYSGMDNLVMGNVVLWKEKIVCK